MKRLKDFIKQVFKMIRIPEMQILPGHLAFFMVLSVIPILTLVGVVGNWLSVSVNSIINFMISNFPEDVSSLLVPVFEGQGFSANVGLFTAMAFFIASNGCTAMILAANALYQLEQTDTVQRRVKAIIMTIILVFLIIFILVVFAFGSTILDYVFSLGVFQKMQNEISIIFLLIKWPVTLILLFSMIKLIYTIAPDKNLPSRLVNKGAMFTTVGWIIATFIFSFYTAHFSNYNIYYGTISNIIVLMMWIYIIAYIFVIGLAFNASAYNNMLKENGKNLHNNKNKKGKDNTEYTTSIT